MISNEHSKCVKVLAVAVVLALLRPMAAAYELPSSTGTHRVVFSSEEGDFNEYTRVINLKGSVELDELGADEGVIKTIKARYLTVNIASNTVRAPEDFVMDYDSGTTYGTSGVFDYNTGTGLINNGRFAYKDFVFSGKKVELGGSRYIYRKAVITTCDDSPPHYRIKSSRAYIAPGRYFLAYNNFFYIGRLPVFYFPVLYKPLIGGTPFISSFSPGVDDRNGTYVKSTYTYKFNPYTKGKLFLDYFSKRGFGTGGEVDYIKKEKTITNLSVYRIKESGTDFDRWGANGGYWHMHTRFNETAKASYYSQSFFRMMSDPEFNNDFFRDNPFSVSPDKQVNLALTRRSNYTITRLSMYEKYSSAADLKHFYKSYESAPRLDYQIMPFRIGKAPFLNSFSGFFESAKESGLPYYQRKGQGTWTISETVPLVRHLILQPSAFYSQNVYVATSAATVNQWIGRYGTNLNLRYDRLWGSFDLNYAYSARMAVNKLRQDVRAADNGEENKSLSPSLFIMSGYNTYFKANTSYDLRETIHGCFSKRLAPLTAEFYHAPRKNLDVYLQDSYIFGEGNRSMVAQINAGDQYNYVGLGLANYSSEPSAYIVTQRLGFRVPWATSWRAETILAYKFTREQGLDLRNFDFFEKNLVLYKDFHDFRSRWFFRTRKGVNEFFFLLSLKMNDSARNDPLEEASRNYWHPWRKEGQLRD